MAKGKHRPGRSLNENERRSFHIVEFSQGKPNELSLNVLDNLAKESDQKGQKNKRRLWGRKNKGAEGASAPQTSLPPSQDSFAAPGATASFPVQEPAKRGKGIQSSRKKAAAAAHANTGASATPSYLAAEANAEIERRKKRRRTGRRISLLAAFAVLLVLAGIGIYNIQGELQRIEANRSLVEEAGFHLGKTDKTLIEVDAFFSEPLEGDLRKKTEKLEEQIKGTGEELEEARKYAVLADEDAAGLPRDKEAAEAVLNSAKAREEFFDVALKRLKIDREAKELLSTYEKGEEELVNANTLLLQAAEVIAHTTKDTVGQSTQLLTQAASSYSAAASAFEAVVKEDKKVDLKDQIKYIGYRQKAIEAALESNAAILLQDRPTATKFNDRYNELDRKAVKLAKKMKGDPAQELLASYVAESRPLEERYTALRNDIASSDAALREYFAGSTGSGESQSEQTALTDK